VTVEALGIAERIVLGLLGALLLFFGWIMLRMVESSRDEERRAKRRGRMDDEDRSQ